MWAWTISPQRTKSPQYKSTLCIGHLWKYWLKSLKLTATATPLKFLFQKSMPWLQDWHPFWTFTKISVTRKFKLIKYSYISHMYSMGMWFVHIHPHSLKSILLNSTYYGIGTGKYTHVLFVLPSSFSPSLSLPVQVSIRIFCFCIIY